MNKLHATGAGGGKQRPDEKKAAVPVKKKK
jgi:hypothetical protein